MKRSLPFIIILVVLLLAVGAVWKMWRANQPAAGELPLPSASNSSSAPVAQRRAIPGQTVTIDEYGDYQCPPCGLLYPELKKIESEYGSSVHLVFHHFPLTKIHKNAMAAAHAAEAAGRQNRFWEMHDRLYVNQKAWADEPDARPAFITYARDLGLNVDRFTSDMNSRDVDAKVAADFKEGEGRGITGTPTLLLDGNTLKAEATTPLGIRRGIDYLLARKAASQPSH